MPWFDPSQMFQRSLYLCHESIYDLKFLNIESSYLVSGDQGNIRLETIALKFCKTHQKIYIDMIPFSVLNGNGHTGLGIKRPKFISLNFNPYQKMRANLKEDTQYIVLKHGP